MSLWFLLLSCAVYLTAASVIPSPRPLVLWHGLGDSYSSPGMLQFMELIKEKHPGIFIHSIFISEDPSEDKKAGFYGDIREQLDLVADQLAAIPELEAGFDAVGLSQGGGQFLRAYVERYNHPPVHNLITFGSQHLGISDIPLCRPFDFLCEIARKAAKTAVYSTWAQKNLIQAQYYRDPSNFETYLHANHFLPYINNEIEGARNRTFARNLASLNKLVLVMFTEDKTVVPKESSWFGYEEIEDDVLSSTSDQQPFSALDKQMVPMRKQRLYVEDWIGLRALDERGAVAFAECIGEHMEMGDCWEELIVEYTGGKA